MCVPSFIVIGYCVSELHGHICRYCNVLPEDVYCCFTRTTLFTKLFTCFYDQSYKLLSCHQVSLLYTFWFLRLNVLTEAVYCCFTRTTLLTTMFTVVIVVCSLKSMCIQSFILIGCCVRAIYVPIVTYCLRLFIVVLQELHCLPNCLHVCMIRV